MHREETRGFTALSALLLSACVAWGVLWVVPNNNRLAAIQDCTLQSDIDDPELAWSFCSDQVAHRE